MQWRRFLKNPLVLFGFSVLTLLLFLALTAPMISPYNPNKINYDSIYTAPNNKFILGTDELGRDVFSRLIYGARTSLIVGIFALLPAWFFLCRKIRQQSSDPLIQGNRFQVSTQRFFNKTHMLIGKAVKTTATGPFASIPMPNPTKKR